MTTKISYAFWILFAGAMLPLGWLFFLGCHKQLISRRRQNPNEFQVSGLVATVAMA
jgi:hypothetical protein